MSVSQRTGSQPSAAIPSITASLRALNTPIQFLKGVGPRRSAELEKIGLRTVEDLLYHLPFRYEDRRDIKLIKEALPGAHETFIGRLAALSKRYNLRRRARLVSALLSDHTGSLELLWFRAPPYLVERLQVGARLLVHGKVETDARSGKRIVHPEFGLLAEAAEEGEGELQRILPVYLHPGGVSLSMLRKWIDQAMGEYGRYLPLLPPLPIRERLGLLSPNQALAELHGPSPASDCAALNAMGSTAHRSLIFEELFCFQLGLMLRRKSLPAKGGVKMAAPRRQLTARMRELLPFALTGAQERVLREIDHDMNLLRPMQRLIQGDVGCGKTMVAWIASLRVLESGYQAVWMAPTELLAEQHFRSITDYAKKLDVEAALLTGSQSAAEKKKLLTRVENGEVQFVVGTQALIQDGVRVPRLGLAVVDEQHRFGVMQRLSLRRLLGANPEGVKGAREPHMLLMSATPIPRSLALVLYGDLDLSLINEMPPGRQPIRTRVCYPQDRRLVYETVLRELRQGHQAFIVYPLVEASEQTAEIRDATQMAQKMRAGLFKQFGVGLAHGRMPSEEREAAMRSFRDGTTGVLVATTVVEVGIDIPNATVVVIEHAERFGLSQLHQLRGRVGRGGAPACCLLINRAPHHPLAAQRLSVMEREQDGFKIAEADLELRGPGEFLGTRQSGIGDFRMANLARDAAVLIEAREEARLWLEKDPELKSAVSAGLRETLLYRWGRRLQIGTVG